MGSNVLCWEGNRPPPLPDFVSRRTVSLDTATRVNCSPVCVWVGGCVCVCDTLQAAKSADEGWVLAVCLPRLVTAATDLFDGRVLTDPVRTNGLYHDVTDDAAAPSPMSSPGDDSGAVAATGTTVRQAGHMRAMSTPVVASVVDKNPRLRLLSVRAPSIRMSSGELMQIHMAGTPPLSAWTWGWLLACRQHFGVCGV